MAADELGSRVNNDISAVLNRTDEVRGTESVVDYGGRPCLCAIFAIASISGISEFGLPRVSM